MAPKPVQEAVLELRRSGKTEAAIRARLLAEGKSTSRVSQLLKATRASGAPEARGLNLAPLRLIAQTFR